MSPTSAQRGDEAREVRRHRLAWLPVPGFIALFAAAAWIQPRHSFEPRFLLPALNVVFITGVGLFVAGLAARSYTAGESLAVLLLGCGSLSFAAGSAVAAAAVLFAVSPNTVVTAHNLAALLAGGCFLASAVTVLTAGRVSPRATVSRSPMGMVLSYGATVSFIALVTVATLDALLPPFFIQGTGPTLTRQIVLTSAIAMFVSAAVLFRLIRRSPSPFIDWYSMSLLLIAVGMSGVLVQHAVGSVIGWTGRAAQYLGCTYMFVAVLSLPRGSRAWRISLDRDLRETERRHRSLVDMCPDAILVHCDGKYVFANPAAARLFGAPSPDAVIGREVLELVHPAFRHVAAERVHEAYDGHATPLQEMRFLRLDGSPIDVEVTGAAVEFRRRPAIQIVARDVSARRRAEEALRLQSSFAGELLQASDKQVLFDLLADRIYSVAGGAMVAVSEFDPRHRKVVVRSVRCTDAERAVARKAFGRDPEGLSLDFLERTRARWIVGELTPVPGGIADLLFWQVPEPVCDTLTREIGLGDIFGMACAYEEDILATVAVLTRRGDPLPQKKLIESLVASAGLALKRARIDDERKQLEQELRASEGLLRAVTDHTTDAVYVKDRESRWLMANPALLRIVNRPAEDVLGLTDAEIYSDPAIGEAIVANDRRVIASGKPGAFEEAAETPEGIRWFLSTKAPMRDAAGQIVGVIGISRDITERRQMEETLREADRRKTEFIAMLSHELRNPLAPIRYALPLIGQAPLPERAAGALTVVSRQVDHLVRLVDDLLDVSRITRGKIDLRREPVTLESVIASAVESASPLIHAGRHALSVRVADVPVWMDVDPARASQIVTNLLTNAAKYTPAGGEILLEAGREGNWGVIRVRDTGIGIPTEALSTIFEMFNQVRAPHAAVAGRPSWGGSSRWGEPSSWSGSSDPTYGPDPAVLDGRNGLGIGLALVKKLVEMHGGTIEAQSAGPGRGAEFVVRLPLARETVPAVASPHGPAKTAASLGGADLQVRETPGPGSCGVRTLKVLIVDDNADLVTMLAAVISALGHDVREARDGAAAVSVALAYRPDVVLLDLGLPVMSGIEVARVLRAHPETAGTRLVAFTGWGQEGDRLETAEAGFDRHLTKPTDPDTLEQLLTEFASKLTSRS